MLITEGKGEGQEEEGKGEVRGRGLYIISFYPPLSDGGW